ncbi:hypothetical protein ABZ896_29225 [Streptomyces sp. NPDC047072]|uniref:hypothetical protein n=1 Tax=Streptomyces sp. NPDC047072 TaxID=3154809 RepID=UPI0034030014
MGTIVITGTVVLVVLGFGNHTWWLVAVAVLFLYTQYGRGGATRSQGSSAAGPGATAGSYRTYRNRRDQQAKWDRRYRRERPFESRRQARERKQ